MVLVPFFSKNESREVKSVGNIRREMWKRRIIFVSYSESQWRASIIGAVQSMAHVDNDMILLVISAIAKLNHSEENTPSHALQFSWWIQESKWARYYYHRMNWNKI